MFNYVDFILIIIILVGSLYGWQRGFIFGLIRLLTLGLSLWIAFTSYLYIATYLDDQFGIQERWLFPLSFFSAFAISHIILSFILYLSIKPISNKTHQSTLNKMMGLIPGTVRGLMYAGILSVFFLFFPLWPNLNAKTKESYLADFFTQKLAELDTKIAPDISEEIKQSISRLTIEPESDETVYLHYKVEKPLENEKFEDLMLKLLNRERRKFGLKLLEKDVEIRAVARAHSKDMFQKGYFSHYNLENKSPFDRLKAKEIVYKTAGENLALAQTVEIAHHGLMNSPGHRANILNPKFGRVGIGIYEGGIYGLMVTQNFRN